MGEWIEYVDPHVADDRAMETLTPKVALAFIRVGLVVGVVAGLVVGLWHREDLRPPYERWEEARTRAAELAAEQCREFPNSVICRTK